MALTDQELLLLDNFMYMEGSVNPGKEYANLGELVNDYLDNPQIWQQEDIENEAIDYGEVLREISENPKLCELGLGEATPMATDDEIRGRCFTEYDEAGNVAGHVVAFRGTGTAWEAWKDNCEGAYLAETKCQGMALEFVESLPYDDITVTGHSKGGNLAMYVTAMLGDKIDRCVSFDGQGFGEAFYAMIPEELLKAASEKTTSVSAYNDFVNILLTPFAGTNICVPNTGENAHSAYDLYTSNEAALENGNNNGYFTEDMAVDRKLGLEWADVGIEAIIRFLPEDEKVLLADLAGSVSGIIGDKSMSASTLAYNLGGDLGSYGEKKMDKAGIFLGSLLGGFQYIKDKGADVLTGIGGNAKELLADGNDDLLQLSQNAGGNLDLGAESFGAGIDVIGLAGEGIEVLTDSVKVGVVEFVSDVKDTVIDVYEAGVDTLEFVESKAKEGLTYLDNLVDLPWER